MQRFIQPLLILSAVTSLLAQNKYFGPSGPIPKEPHLIQVEVFVKDSPDPNGLQIQSVTFDGSEIPLKPRDLYGYRGGGSFKKTAGKYKLTWVVNRDKFAWPRNVSHVEEVTLDPRDMWIQIQIEGETASIR